MNSLAPRCLVEFRSERLRLIEDALESLILLLDEIDGDDGLEDGGDDENEADAEAWLGSSAMFDQSPWGKARPMIAKMTTSGSRKEVFFISKSRT